MLLARGDSYGAEGVLPQSEACPHANQAAKCLPRVWKNEP